MPKQSYIPDTNGTQRTFYTFDSCFNSQKFVHKTVKIFSRMNCFMIRMFRYIIIQYFTRQVADEKDVIGICNHHSEYNRMKNHFSTWFRILDIGDMNLQKIGTGGNRNNNFVEYHWRKIFGALQCVKLKNYSLNQWENNREC